MQVKKHLENSLYFIDRQFWHSPALVILFAASIFLIVFLRYLLVSSAYHVLVTRLFRNSARRFTKVARNQWRREVKWSMVSAAIFTVLTAGCLWLYHDGLTRIYTNLHAYGIAYFIFSIVFLLAGYETYYYWLHRWMHHPKIFRHVHKVHHDSIETSVFTSFSFHPLEAILQFLFLPLAIMVLPVHYYALGIVLTLWTVSAIINHAGVEIFPENFRSHPVGKWLIGATHHDLHHREFKSNFGLYFTFWDKWMRTESKNFGHTFASRTRPTEVSRSRSPHHPSTDGLHK